MPSTLEQVTALPVSGNVDKAALRAMLTRRTPLTLSAAESLVDFTVTDPASGVVPLCVIQNGTLFEYDSLDTTTVASAVCLVSGDTVGLRYKSGGITPPYSVLTVGTTAQPVSPSVGDAYLIPTAATGTDWAGQDGKIGIYSRAGWQFAINPIGRGLYAEDTNIRWYRNAAGTWVSGFGDLSLGSSVFASSAIIGAGAAFIRKVENQTTTTAPASPVAPVAYIVAGNGGAWSAYSVGDLAICDVDGSWTRAVPTVGDEVFDKALNFHVRWNGTAWVSAAGSIVGYATPANNQASVSPTVTNPGSSYTYSDTTAPSTLKNRGQDPATISYTAKSVNNKLRIKYRARVSALVTGLMTFGVLRDTDQDAIGWDQTFIFDTPHYIGFVNLCRIITPSDTNNHTYKMFGFELSNVHVSAFSHRLFEIEEIAS